MYHIVPVFCILAFVIFLEVRLKRELIEIEHEFKLLKEEILKNRENINKNKNLISKIDGEHMR